MSALRLRVTATAESVVRSGHPWLYAESIREQNRPGHLGELAIIYDRRDRFLAVGLFDPDSPLRVRILHSGKPIPIDAAWWKTRLHDAMERRSTARLSQTELVRSKDERTPMMLPNASAPTTGYRWIHGESDGWPGLVLDRYETTLAIKLYTAAWLPRLAEIVSLFQQQLQPDRIVLRLSRNIQAVAGPKFGRRDGQILYGPPLGCSVVFRETGLRFEADVLRGQKTGFFLDQRDNRRRVEALARGRRTLNVFSFSGGFSLYAARGGATAVTDVDLSQHALEGATRNFALNACFPAVSTCLHESVQADAFEWLAASQSRVMDLIILDPPSLAKREAERNGAIQAYRRLVSGALPRLRRNGVLVAASCSAHVSACEFFEAVRQSIGASHRSFSELATTGHPPDHPATFPEAEYLKAIYLQLDNGSR